MLKSIKINGLLKKWAEDINRHPYKEDIQISNRDMKGYSAH